MVDGDSPEVKAIFDGVFVESDDFPRMLVAVHGSKEKS